MIRPLLCLVLAVSCCALLPAQKRWANKLDWGHITATEDAIYFHVTSVPNNRVLQIPRLYNSYEELYLQSDSTKKPLAFKPEVDHWLITLPKGIDDSAIVVMKTVGKPRPIKDTVAITPAVDGSVTLPACLATVHGEKLRFEPQPHKNTIGYWAVVEDWCEWTVDVPEAGSYEVSLWQGCGTGKGGSEVEVRAGESQLSFIVEDTGHFQNFKERNIGKINLKAGKQSFQIRPKVKAKNAVMDVRLVVLRKSEN